jgi:lipoyl-dependent peroxiredoxin
MKTRLGRSCQRELFSQSYTSIYFKYSPPLAGGYGATIFVKKQTRMKRNATAIWNGSGKEGNGTMSTQSTLLNNAQYSYKTRFEDGVGTNPEELIAAAHAGCFSMKLSFVLGGAGFTPEKIETKCYITLENGAVTTSELELTATIPGITAEKFNECAEDAKANCPISKLLNCNIALKATLA